MSHSATLTSPLSLPSSGGLLALIELAASFLGRERLTAEERAFLEKMRTVSDQYGTYLLEAADREDLQARVDAVLEDPRFYKDFLQLTGAISPSRVSAIVQDLQDTAHQDVSGTALAQALGPAAIPALRRLDRVMGELGRCLGILFKGATPAMELPAPPGSTGDTLPFLSDPQVPVQVARALLGTYRTSAVVLAIGAARFSHVSLERWLGLAVAELMAKESRCFLALLAALTGTEVPTDILPPEERLDIHVLHQSAEPVLKAYARFNMAAERSGEPVYPSTP